MMLSNASPVEMQSLASAALQPLGWLGPSASANPFLMFVSLPTTAASKSHLFSKWMPLVWPATLAPLLLLAASAVIKAVAKIAAGRNIPKDPTVGDIIAPKPPRVAAQVPKRALLFEMLGQGSNPLSLFMTKTLPPCRLNEFPHRWTTLSYLRTIYLDQGGFQPMTLNGVFCSYLSSYLACLISVFSIEQFAAVCIARFHNE